MLFEQHGTICTRPLHSSSPALSAPFTQPASVAQRNTFTTFRLTDRAWGARTDTRSPGGPVVHQGLALYMASDVVEHMGEPRGRSGVELNQIDSKT